VIDHEEYPQRDIGGNRFVRTVVGLRDDRHTRQRRIRYVQVDGQDPARLVLAIRLRLHARRPARHLFAGRNLSQYRKLPARGTVEALPGVDLFFRRTKRLRIRAAQRHQRGLEIVPNRWFGKQCRYTPGTRSGIRLRKGGGGMLMIDILGLGIALRFGGQA
jgi:hypothetical protein